MCDQYLFSFPFSSSPLHLTFPSLSLSLSTLFERPLHLSVTPLSLSLSLEHETLHDRIKRISFDRRSGRTNKSVERARFVSFRFVDDCERRSAIVPSRRRRIGPPWEQFWFITSLSRPRSLGYPSCERRSRFPFSRKRLNDCVCVKFCLLLLGYYWGKQWFD